MSGDGNADTELRLEVSVLDESFTAGEEIVAQVLLFNFGDDPVTVNARLALIGSTAGAGEVVLEIAGPGGDVPFLARVRIGAPSAEDFVPLPPWNCVGRRYELLAYFDIEEPGEYEVTAVYTSRLPEDGDVEPWVGTLRSEPARFRLVD